MKKTFCAASVFPSLLIASGVIFASSDGVMQLSDVNDSLKQITQEQKESQDKPQGWGQVAQPGQPVRPDHPGQPVRPDHPGQPVRPDHPGQPPKPPQPPQPPVQVDTTHARNAGIRDGVERGGREGRREGYADGIDSGEREGRRRGTDEGDTAGRNSGYRDGYTVDQYAGTQRGNADGQNSGITNGTQAGQKRCYNEGYTNGYNGAFAVANQLGLQDAASYNGGYAKGQADAATIEAANGQKAGYQAGFSLRELELQNSSLDTKGLFAKSAMTRSSTGLPIELARNGYTTPEEQRAYREGYQEGYNRSYRRAYDDAKRDGYNERFTMAYRRAYDSQYSLSYRYGFTEGKEKGYQEAYNSAYNTAYNSYFYEFSGREYSSQRALGMNNGQTVGQQEGFAAGCAEQTKRGYKAGYETTAAAVYPGAFEAGKQSGIAAADRYYSENSVLKVFNVSFYDENNNGKFEASENVMLKAEVKNFGFQKSDVVTMVVKSERGEIVLVADLKADGVGGRAKGSVNLNIGRLYDVVAPDSDALTVTFLEKGRTVGSVRQMYTRTNPNKVGVVAKDDTSVTKKASIWFPSEVANLNRGEKVVITETKGDFYKVRRAELGAGNWTEGYIKSNKLNLQ